MIAVTDLASFLFDVLGVLLLLNVPVALILTWAAAKRPHIWALTVMAILSDLVALALATYVWAVGNATSGYPVEQDIARAILRGCFVGLALFPPIFLWVYLTGRFRDGGS